MPGYYKHVVWTNIVSESSPQSIMHLMIHNFSVKLAAIDSVHRLLEVGPHYGNRHQPIIWAGMTSTSKLLHCEKLNKDTSRACVVPCFVHYLMFNDCWLQAALTRLLSMTWPLSTWVDTSERLRTLFEFYRTNSKWSRSQFTKVFVQMMWLIW